jgi:SAM-dependent methyltransferase
VAATSGAAHWDERYGTVGATSVSWYEEHPTTSLALLAALAVQPDDSVIDVGGGASTLVDHLLRAGHRDVTVLDLSSVALEAARARLGDAPGVAWIEHDLVTWHPPRRWDVWHDRAVLHFLVLDRDRSAYSSLLRRTLEPGGAFVIGTFAEDGPTHCSALPVRRHSIDDLEVLVGDAEIVEAHRAVHRTPAGVDQPFNWIAGRLRGA